MCGGGIQSFFFIMKIQLIRSFENLISVENILEAWREFIKGKKNKADVQNFQLNLMDNIFLLYNELENNTYKHGGYQEFDISDPKPRRISKASVKDRLLHRAIYRVLYPFFDIAFISDSYSCRIGKGTHKAIDKFFKYFYKVSKNNIRTCWVLKCDIRKFFDNINHQILLKILDQYISDKRVVNLLREIVGSFHSYKDGVGLPLGNLTSQLFVNIYMNEFDQFVKHKLKSKFYIRCADDFVLLSEDKNGLEKHLDLMGVFLKERLGLELHPDKVFIKTFASGVDFLGWINFPDCRILRTSTKRRMMKKIKQNPFLVAINSYLGLLEHGSTYKLRKRVVSSQF